MEKRFGSSWSQRYLSSRVKLSLPSPRTLTPFAECAALMSEMERQREVYEVILMEKALRKRDAQKASSSRRIWRARRMRTRKT